MKLIHHSPLGALEIPGVLGAPEPGDVFEVDDDIGEGLLAQEDLYSVAPTDELTVPELRELAEQRGIDHTGLKKADLIAVLAADTEGTSE